MNIQEHLLQDGAAHGMCEKFQKEWGNPSVKELCEKYFAGQDFCIKHNWPSLDWLQENMAGKTAAYGIFINQEAELISSPDEREMALLGDSKVTYEAYDMCDITVRHNSTLNLKAHHRSFVYVSLHDNATLNIVSKDDNARICVSHFSGNINNKELVDRYYKKG